MCSFLKIRSAQAAFFLMGSSITDPVFRGAVFLFIKYTVHFLNLIKRQGIVIKCNVGNAAFIVSVTVIKRFTNISGQMFSKIGHMLI